MHPRRRRRRIHSIEQHVLVLLRHLLRFALGRSCILLRCILWCTEWHVAAAGDAEEERPNYSEQERANTRFEQCAKAKAFFAARNKQIAFVSQVYLSYFRNSSAYSIRGSVWLHYDWILSFRRLIRNLLLQIQSNQERKGGTEGDGDEEVVNQNAIQVIRFWLDSLQLHLA